jgi:hypothetical protein
VYNLSFLISYLTFYNFITFLDFYASGLALTAYFALGLFFSSSCFKALAKAFLTISCFASSVNSALDSVFGTSYLSTSAFNFSFFSLAKAALIVFYIKAYFASSESSLLLVTVSVLDFSF